MKRVELPMRGLMRGMIQWNLRRDFMAGWSLVLMGLLLSTMPAAAQQTPASAGPPSPQLIEDLVAANRILADQGIVDGYGHVSVRHDRDPNRYLMSRSRAPELVTAGDIMEYDLDSNPVDAQGRASYRERFIHGEIYKARPDVQAIVHHHSPVLIPFGAGTVPLQPIYHMASFIGGGIPVFEIRRTAGMTDLLVKTPQLGVALAETLGDRPAILMRGHGTVVAGLSLSHMVGRSVYLAMNARLQAQAMALGGPVSYLDPEEARLSAESRDRDKFQRAWELWKRKALAN
ncbi:MAG: class II aldolase/adducin family protein [SAR324 cluster bacterium]|nr:class II aldolase/adducin family protein [SAR324 cluster bacterium]